MYTHINLLIVHIYIVVCLCTCVVYIHANKNLQMPINYIYMCVHVYTYRDTSKLLTQTPATHDLWPFLHGWDGKLCHIQVCIELLIIKAGAREVINAKHQNGKSKRKLKCTGSSSIQAKGLLGDYK